MDSQLPETQFAHAFDPQTREYNGPVKVYLSSPDGTHSLPENTVACAPGEAAGVFKTFRLLPSMDGWEQVPDYRRAMLYDTATAQPVPNRLALGDELPDTVTTTQPIALSPFDYRRNQWDASVKAWRAIPDYSGHPLWEKATAERAAPLQPGQALPATLTTTPPIALMPSDYQRNQWDASTQTWRTIPDYSGHPLWDKATGEPAAPLPPGQALPAALTTVAPPMNQTGPFHWDATTEDWVATSDVEA